MKRDDITVLKYMRDTTDGFTELEMAVLEDAIATLERLPVTKDNHIVSIGDEVFCRWAGMVGPLVVTGIRVRAGEFVLHADDGLSRPVSDCFSTREAAEAAKEVGG